MLKQARILLNTCIVQQHIRTLALSWDRGAQLPELPSESIFSAACSDFVKSMSSGMLIPVPTINLADNVKPLQLVIKHRKKWMYLFETVEYRPTEFQITDVMTDGNNLPVKIDSSNMVVNYNKTAKIALKGKIGANIAKNVLGLGLNVQDSFEIDVNFKTVKKSELAEPDLLTQLQDRRINLNHQYVRQIRCDKSKSLCVITAVSDLANGGVIKQKTGTDVSASATAKMLKSLSLTGGTGISKGREIILPANTPVAYRVRELFVDEDCGSMELVLTRDTEGGFVTNIGTNALVKRCEQCERPAHLVTTQLDEVFRPILQLPNEQKENLRNLLLDLLKVPRDICLLADIVDVQLARPYSIDELENMMILPQEQWLPLLKITGFSVQENQVKPPDEFSTLFKSTGDFLDALTVLDDDILELLPYCSQESARTLMKVLFAGMEGGETVDEQIVEKIRSDTVVMTVLKILKFDNRDNRISPPVELSPIIDEVYIVLYILWG